MTVSPELILDDDADDTGVYINPLTAQYVYDPALDIEYVVVLEDDDNNCAYGADPFNLIAAREESTGCPLAQH